MSNRPDGCDSVAGRPRRTVDYHERNRVHAFVCCRFSGSTIYVDDGGWRDGPAAGYSPVEPGERLADVPRGSPRAEELGYDHLWTWDHLYAIFGDPHQPILEGYTALAAVAQATARSGSGCSSAPIPSETRGWRRSRVVTIDHISDGRAIMGIGGAWFEARAHSVRLRLRLGFGQRLDWLAEAVPADSDAARRW